MRRSRGAGPSGGAAVRSAELSSSESSDGRGSASAASSQWQKPGTGERVVKRVRLRNSAESSSTTCLIRKLPKLIRASPGWQLLIE